MSIKSTILAASALLLSANAHMVMKSPVPYSVDKLDNGPINAAQWPCKHNLGYTVSKQNAMKVGEQQKISFSGSATHGGGSCQLAITTDKEPNANSVFKVIKTIEGGCPGSEPGAPANEYSFELPASIPNGDVTFAWTWFARMSGAPEMYMNCAPVTVTGGSSDTSGFNALPDMFVANVGNGCTTDNSANVAVQIPNPGSVVEKGPDTKFAPPKGNCGKTGTTPPPAVSSAPGGAPSPAPTSAVAAPSPAPTSAVAAPSAPASSAAPIASSPVSAAPPANSGFVGAPGVSTMTTLLTVTATPSAAVPSAVAPSVPAGTGSPAPTGAPATPGAGSGTCSTEGAIVCSGTTMFGLCNFGKVVYQPVAAGTTCSDGKIMKRGYHGRIARPRA